MIETWRKQFSLKQLSLEHDKPITFIISQWQKEPKPSKVYLVYRWIVALIFLTTFILSIIDLKHPEANDKFRAKWLIYLTNWGYTICTFQALIAALLLSISMLSTSKATSIINTYRVYWLLNIIATDIAFGITVLYWTLVYDAKTMDFDTMNFFLHANNSIIMLLDLLVVSHPVNLLHVSYTILFGICYAVFSGIYYAVGGTSRTNEVYIYKILDWTNIGVTIGVCFGVLIFILIIHVMVWYLHKLRIKMHKKYYMDADQKGLEEIPEPSKTAYVNEGMANDIV